jgi:NDP-sugar pyrophosphorylase family protein
MRGLSDTPQVVLLVGGRGTRLRPLTDDLPKCLAPVGGRPFLEYVIELYARQGIRDLALCSGYLAERIVDAVGNGSRWGVTIQHSIEPAPLGTIGALRYAAAVLHETFVLSYGDIYPAMPVARLIEKSRTVEQPAVMTVAPADDGDTSIAHGRITAYEKGASAGTHSWTECGMLALERRLLFEHDSTDENGFYGWLARTGRIAALIDDRHWLEIGDVRGYQEFCMVVAAGLLPGPPATPQA